jgi:hypothetical protein
VDPEFEEVTEDELDRVRETQKKVPPEALIVSEKRINHPCQGHCRAFEKRREVKGGKLIVCMSRVSALPFMIRSKASPCLVRQDDKEGFMKVIMNGSGKGQILAGSFRMRAPAAIGDRFKMQTTP